MLLASASVSAHHVTISLAQRDERLTQSQVVFLPSCLSVLIAVEISSRLLLLNENSFVF